MERTSVDTPITPPNQPPQPLETEILIVGAGQAGASLVCFLARYEISGLVISAAPSTADTPRAHMNNMAAMECLRDIGLWEECRKLGHAGDTIKHFRYFSGSSTCEDVEWALTQK